MGEAKAEAVAAWEQFQSDVDDALLSALAGAFAMVACADGRLAEEEVDRFVLLVDRTGKFPQVDAARLEERFRSLCGVILADFDAGFRAATEVVASVRDNAEQRKLVIGAAQIAIVADEELAESEEAALRVVCEALGVDPAGY